MGNLLAGSPLEVLEDVKDGSGNVLADGTTITTASARTLRTGQVVTVDGQMTVLVKSGALTQFDTGTDPGGAGLCSSWYYRPPLTGTPSYIEMGGEVSFRGGNASKLLGGGVLACCNAAFPLAAHGKMLHGAFSYAGVNLGGSPDWTSGTQLIPAFISDTFTRQVPVVLTKDSPTVTAVSGGTFDVTEQPVGVTCPGYVTGSVPYIDPGTGTTLTYVSDTTATLSNVALKSGTAILSIVSPLRTDGSQRYPVKLIADSKLDLVQMLLPNGAMVQYKVVPRVDVATVASGSATVLDTAVIAGDAGKPVVADPANGIPSGCFVGPGSLVPFTSFKLSSSPTTQVDVPATGNGTKVSIGFHVADILGPQLIWEISRSNDTSSPIMSWHDMYAIVRYDAGRDNAGPSGVMAQIARLLGGDLWGRRHTFYAAKLGRVASPVGDVAGVALGSAQDAGIYRLAAHRTSVDGGHYADVIGVRQTSYSASVTLDPDYDGDAEASGGSNLTFTLPLSALTAKGHRKRITNLNATPLIVQLSGSDKVAGTWQTLTLQTDECVELTSNGNNTWQGGVGFHLGMVLTGVPTVVAGVGAGGLRADTATVASASATVLDASIGTGDAGKAISGTGIPVPAFVGSVVAGTSFQIMSTPNPVTQVPLLATANGTTVNVSTAPAPTLRTGATDLSMIVLWGTGSAPVAGGAMFHVAFSAKLPFNPKYLNLTPAIIGGQPGTQSYADPFRATNALSSSMFVVSATSPGASQASGTYALSCEVKR